MIESPTGQRQRLAACLQPPGRGFRLDAVGPHAAGRSELEDYVRAAFLAKHGAVVRSFMPTLLAFRDRASVLRGVVGIRGAHEERLYLEQYLDRPVEDALATALAARGVEGVHRARIAEVGNLAGNNCRAAVRMVAHVPAYLMSQRVPVDRLHGDRRPAADPCRFRRAARRTCARQRRERRDGR